MSHDDSYGMPLDQPAYEVSPPGYEMLADGDGRVLAAAGLNRHGSDARNKAAATAVILALLVGAGGLVVSSGVFNRTADVAEPPAEAVSTSALASPEPVVSSSAPPTAETPTAKPKPATPPAPPGRSERITRANSRTRGGDYSLTVPRSWSVERNLRRDSVVNVDVRIRNATKSHSLTIATVSRTVAPAKLTPAVVAAIKAAALKAEPGARALPGSVTGVVAGAAAVGFDTRVATPGIAVTLRTLLWQRAGITYSATWRAPTAGFAPSLPTFTRILGTVRYAG